MFYNKSPWVIAPQWKIQKVEIAEFAENSFFAFSTLKNVFTLMV